MFSFSKSNPNSSNSSNQTALTSHSDESDGESILIAVAADPLTSSVNIEKSIAFIRALVLEIKADCEILIGDKNLSMAQNFEKLNETNIKYVKTKLSLVYVRSNVNVGEFKHEIQILTRDFVQVARVYLEIYKEFKGLISDLKEASHDTATTTYSKEDSIVYTLKSSTPRRQQLSRDSSSTSNDSDENKTVGSSGAATPPSPRSFRSRSNSEASSVDIESGKKNGKQKPQKKPSKIKRAFTYVMGVFGFGGNSNHASASDDSARSKSTLAYYTDDGNLSGIDEVYDDHSHANITNACLDQHNNASIISDDGRNKLWKTRSSIELNKNNLPLDTCDAKSQSSAGGAPKVQTFFDMSHPVSNSSFSGKVNHCEVHYDSSDPTIIPAEPDELY